MKNKTSIEIIAMLVAFSLFAVSFAIAAPTGPTVTDSAPERRTSGIDSPTTGTTVAAQAGNVTELFINSTRLTDNWQGYYGNVTGQIILDDASGNSMYDWQMTSPSGEIYASNYSAITWGNVGCVNLTEATGIGYIFNETNLEDGYSMESADLDGIGETFNTTFSGSFTVGSTTIDANDGCYQTYLYVSDAYQTTNFKEVLLTDNASVIFTSILESDETGFDGSDWDFQMIVAEDGGTAATTNYYFFVELS